MTSQFSFQRLVRHYKDTIQRFPIALGALVGLTIWSIALIFVKVSDQNLHYAAYPILYFTGAYLLSLMLHLIEEAQQNTIGSKAWYLTHGVWLLLCVALFFLMPHWGEAENILEFAALGVTLVLMVLFIPLRHEKNDSAVIPQATAFVVNTIIAYAISGLLFALIALLLVCTSRIFDIKIADEEYMVYGVISMILLSNVSFMHLLPKKQYIDHRSNNYDLLSSFVHAVLKWLLMPILFFYTAILYCYMLHILFTWDLPHGKVATLVSCVMGIYIVVYTAFYNRINENKKHWLSQLLTFYLPIVFLPLLIFMSIGIGRRLYDYGLTAPRLYILTFNLWFYTICIYMLISHSRHKKDDKHEYRFRWIYTSFALIFLLTSAQPLNYNYIAKRYQATHPQELETVVITPNSNSEGESDGY